MDLIDEKDGVIGAEKLFALRLFDHLAYILYAGIDGAQRVERTFQLLRNDKGQGGFAHPGRSPEDHRRDLPAFDGLSEYGPFADQMLLPGKGLQTGRAHSFRQRDTYL